MEMTINNKVIIPQTLESLTALLKSYGVEISEWESKYPNITEKFLIDLNNKEFYLSIENGDLVRHMRAVNAFVYFEDNGKKKQLVEDRQEFFETGNNSVIKRGFEYLSEKIRIGEDPEVAMKRGVEEELGITEGGYTYEFSAERNEEKFSPYHPGLFTHYKFFIYNLLLKKEAYNEAGYIDDEGRRKTFFIWKDL